MKRRILAPFILAASLGCIVCDISANDDATKPSPEKKEDFAIRQEMLARRYREFEQTLLRLAFRLEKSSNEKEQERGKLLKKAVKLAADVDLNKKFDFLINRLSAKDLGLKETEDAVKMQKAMADDIRAILAILMEGDRHEELKKEMAGLEAAIKKLDQAIREQKMTRARTKADDADKARLEKMQKQVNASTQDAGKALGKPMNGGNGGDAKPTGAIPNAQQRIQEAEEVQRAAEEKIRNGNNNGAAGDQEESVRRLEEARRLLDNILRQLRKEEIERVLAALRARCERMLAMQIEVYQGTITVDTNILKNGDKKPTRGDEQASLRLSDKEDEIIKEVSKAIQLLEAEGTAVAFPEVFVQLRDDMRHVSRRLNKADVGSVTQVIEADIITTLKEMIEALKQAQKDNEQPPPPPDGEKPPTEPGKPQLIQIINELKMIKAMQMRVNSRTTVYSEKYTGEQASDPEVKKELQDLSEREKKIFKITKDIADGKNK